MFDEKRGLVWLGGLLFLSSGLRELVCRHEKEKGTKVKIWLKIAKAGIQKSLKHGTPVCLFRAIFLYFGLLVPAFFYILAIVNFLFV
ncbi:hypothetical protein [Lactococcus ileimucosae]|uniref:hypothetical protein n=1 Tax=Lactococcus ileimucosae TaxID=2941329 RepID=UPI0020439EE9|nr:hypothetical protein [Lactococcus ileimucosae]